jgi:hypothetical protein
MGIEMEGAVFITRGEIEAGSALLDEAMASVIGGEVSSFFSGWIYCYVLGACHNAADLRRAGEWTDAAMRWCESLSAGSVYHNICRIHQVEMVGLRGALVEAERQALVARDQLSRWYPALAAEASYLCGELRRRKGDLTGAEEAFISAYQDGRNPEPGLALLRLAQGKPRAASRGLREALTQSQDRLGRARLLAAQCDVAMVSGDLSEARSAADELDALATASGSPALRALAEGARSAQLLAEGDSDGAAACARRAWVIWQELGAPYEAAQARVLLGRAARRSGDEETARLELEAARAAFERLGAPLDAVRTNALLSRPRDVTHGLTQRELEVLRLVAAGRGQQRDRVRACHQRAHRRPPSQQYLQQAGSLVARCSNRLRLRARTRLNRCAKNALPERACAFESRSRHTFPSRLSRSSYGQS